MSLLVSIGYIIWWKDVVEPVGRAEVRGNKREHNQLQKKNLNIPKCPESGTDKALLLERY